MKRGSKDSKNGSSLEGGLEENRTPLETPVKRNVQFPSKISSIPIVINSKNLAIFFYILDSSIIETKKKTRRNLFRLD